MSARLSLVAIGIAGLFNACAVPPAPEQLVEARDAYRESGDGTTARLSPTELFVARQALDSANQEFDLHGDTFRTRDFAYIASRRVELAEVTARTDQDRQTILEAVRGGAVIGEQNPDATATEVELPTPLEAEGRLARALIDLSAIAPVREEARGMVLALDGRDLFVPGTYVLLSEAKETLEHVAAALLAQSDNQPIVVEGHSNFEGYEATTQPFSLNRANAVRDYLVSSGVQPARISALGLASLASPSNNRWVEIVLLAPAFSTLPP
jgi:outer membrane protein OmpA-like peptidoglycan-associated protein